MLSLCLYAVGILLNDLADLDEDRRQRPARPLPSGTISVCRARLAVMGLLVVVACLIGLPLRTVALPAIALAAGVMAYNLGLKRVVVLGEATMATCRGLNVWLGAQVGLPGPAPLPVYLGCAVVIAYVFGLALLARHEVSLGAEHWIGRLVRGLILVQAILIAAAGEPLLGLLVAGLWVPSTWLGRRYASS